MFSRKGIIIIEKTDAVDEDALLETALEAGADDMVVQEDSFEIVTDPAAYTDVHHALADAGYEIVRIRCRICSIDGGCAEGRA